MIGMNVRCFDMSARDRLLRAEEEAWVDFSEELLETGDTEGLKVKNSGCINGVRYVQRKERYLCRKRSIEKEELGRVEKDFEMDKYWEYLMIGWRG